MSEARLVELAFPDYFKKSLKYALASISIYSRESVPNKLSAKQQKFLDKCLSNMPMLSTPVQPKDVPLNRNMTDSEKEVVEYLAKCVLQNKQPTNY